MIYRMYINISLLVDGDEFCADANQVYQDLKENLVTKYDECVNTELLKRNRCLEAISISQEKVR